MEGNGRRILVWNVENAQNEMEDLKNGIEDRLPYLPNSELHILKLFTNHELNVMRLPIRKMLQQDYLCKLQYLARGNCDINFASLCQAS